MKTFKEFLAESKPYNKKGKMNVFKKPVDIDYGLSILAIGHDTNGNRLIRVEVPGGKKSVQLDSSVTITLDDVISGLTDKQIQHIKSSI